MTFLQKYKFVLLGLALGAIAGYAYYYFVGCNSGGCAISSKPLNSTVYGAVMGGLLANINKEKQPQKENENEQ